MEAVAMVANFFTFRYSKFDWNKDSYRAKCLEYLNNTAILN
jgi:hypothetical protein